MGTNPDIAQQISVTPQERIKVTQEQYDIYCQIDTTFEVCKICNSNFKSVRIDPCGHLLCHQCLRKWIDSSNTPTSSATTCPFCRKQVLSTESVTIQPFNPFGEDDDEVDLDGDLEGLYDNSEADNDLEDVDAVIAQASIAALPPRPASAGVPIHHRRPPPVPPASQGTPPRRTVSTGDQRVAGVAPD